MTSMKFLSNKKSAQQTISISPALKDWVQRYVRVMRKKNPNDIRYKSFSRFYCHVMERVLRIFEKGKTLDDIDMIPDKNISDIYEKLTFKAIIPFFNIGILMNKYSDENIKFSPSMFLKFREWVLDDVSLDNYDSMKSFMNRFKKFLLSNKLTKEFKIDFLREKDSQYFKAILEYIGIYKNLHYENCKALAGIFGFLGLNLNSFMFSEKDLYARFDFKETELFTRSDFAKKERMELLEHNLGYLINYYKIINDEDHYLWMKLVKDRDVYINFSNEKILEKWLNIIKIDFQKFGLKKDFLLYLLKFFENLHWIIIEDEDQLFFKFNNLNNNEVEPNKEEDLVLKIIKQHVRVGRENDIYYLEK